MHFVLNRVQPVCEYRHVTFGLLNVVLSSGRVQIATSLLGATKRCRCSYQDINVHLSGYT